MEEMDLLEIWRILLKRKWLIALFFVVAVTAAGIFSFMMEPVYEASTTLMVRDPSSSQLNLFEQLSGGMGSNNMLQNYVQILKSRTLLSRVVPEMGWPEMDASELSALSEKVTVQPVQGTEVLRISYQSTDPAEAERFVNRLAQVFINMNLSDNREEMRSAGDFIEEQLSVVSRELADAEEELRDFRERERVLAPDEETKVALERYAELETGLAEIRISRQETAQRIKEIEEKLAAEDQVLLSSSTEASNPFFNQYRAKLAELEIALSGARERYTEQHPNVLALKAEIEDVRAKLAAEVERNISTETHTINPVHQNLYGQLIGLQVELMALNSREEALRQLRTETDHVFTTLPQQQLALARRMRDTKVLEEIYLMLMTRNEEIRISEAMQTANVRVIDRAIVPENPIKPRKKLNMAIAGVLGIFLGTGLAFLLEYVDTSIKTKEEAESLLELPVLGQIPHFDQSAREPKQLFRAGRKAGI